MKIRAVLLLAGTVGLLLPLISYAQSKPVVPAAPPQKSTPAKTVTAQMYECPICHHKVNAAQAKTLHYTCPVDNGRLALVKTVSQRKTSKPLSHQ